MPSIMMCDDHILVMDALGDCLKKENFTIAGAATNGITCIELIQNGLIPDVLILDISLPDMSGYKVAHYVKNHFPQIKILVLSMITDEEAVKAMIRIGVNGFAFKSINPSELAAIIHSILNGQIYYPPKFIFTQKEINEIVLNPIPWAEHLIDKEILTAQLLANNLSRKQVAGNMGISPSAINKKMERVFKKTKQNTTIGVINFLKSVGIIQ